MTIVINIFRLLIGSYNVPSFALHRDRTADTQGLAEGMYIA